MNAYTDQSWRTNPFLSTREKREKSKEYMEIKKRKVMAEKKKHQELVNKGMVEHNGQLIPLMEYKRSVGIKGKEHGIKGAEHGWKGAASGVFCPPEAQEKGRKEEIRKRKEVACKKWSKPGQAPIQLDLTPWSCEGCEDLECATRFTKYFVTLVTP